MSSPPNDRGGALHVLGDAISAAVTGVAGTLGRSVGSVVVAANKATETVTHVLPGAGTGLTADEYVHQAPDKHAPQPHQGTLKQIEAQTLQELHADKDLSAPVSLPEQARPKVESDPVSEFQGVPVEGVPDGPPLGQTAQPSTGLGRAVAEARQAVEGVVEQASSAAEVVVGNANDEVVEQASSAGDSVAAQASSVAEAVAGGVAPKSSKTYDHEVDDDEALRALLDRPPPEGFEDPIARIPLHPEPAPSLHLPGEEEDKKNPYALPDHLDRGATEAAWNAPEHPGDMGDPAKPSFAAVAAKAVEHHTNVE